jgi:hypothetical protein
MMAGTLRVRRTMGALSGVLLVLLGIWGALIPFVGPYFHYAYSPDHTWSVTAGRMWLEVLPGAITLACGVIVLISRFRPLVVLAAWLAAVGGAWFAVGNLVATGWSSLPSAGQPVGGSVRMLAEQVGFFTGLGVVIVFVAAMALGRFTVITFRAPERADKMPEPQTEPVPASKVSSVLPKRVWPRRAADAEAKKSVNA